jgi:hypothetical protein
VIRPIEEEIALAPTDMHEGEEDQEDLNICNSEHSATKRKSDQVEGSVSKYNWLLGEASSYASGPG